MRPLSYVIHVFGGEMLNNSPPEMLNQGVVVKGVKGVARVM